MNNELLARLRHKLIVSCQDYIEVMIPAAVRGGAAGLRVNGPQAIRFAREKTSLPLLACNKIFFPNSNVYITPSVRTAMSLVRAGAEMIAFDAQALPRPRQSIPEMISAIHGAGRVAVADVGTFEEGIQAQKDGADVVATTFAPRFSPELIGRLVAAGCRVLAEGGINSPEKIHQALDAGAWAACVGTAITRPELIASQFLQALTG
jgi:N-acylglucosamine-6-phosphate 2-epimerase